MNQRAVHDSLHHTDHRPWPLPVGRWSWRQSWLDLLFAHWRIEASLLRALIPAPLELQEFDGSAWIGVVPFRMAGVMRRPLPDVPGLSAFPELNVRTYVEFDGKPGVWFLSLDATNRLAVWAAKRFFFLPYHHARMRLVRRGDWYEYRSQRVRGPAGFEGRFRPVGDPYRSTRGTLEHWLTERYCLYARARDGRLSCTEVHHVPWPLQRAEAEFTNTMLDPCGIKLEEPPGLLHFSERIDVAVWSPRWVG